MVKERLKSDRFFLTNLFVEHNWKRTTAGW
jgi:hypothetical protein